MHKIIKGVFFPQCPVPIVEWLNRPPRSGRNSLTSHHTTSETAQSNSYTCTLAHS